MKRIACALLLLSGVPVLRAADLLPKSFSRSKQFVVYAADGAMRGGIGSVAEETKTGVLEALGLTDQWKLPIVIDLRYPDASMPGSRPPSRLLLGQTGAGLKVEIDLLLGEAGRANRIRDELVRAILLELAYRDYATLPAGQTYNQPPAWLVEGISAYLESEDNGVSASLFAALLPASQTLSLEEFLDRNPTTLDSTSHAIYRAYAFTLVRLLVQDLPGGKAGLASYVHDLPGVALESERGAGALRSHFAELASSADSLDKWWSVSLARVAASDQFQAFTPEETDRRLTAALTFQLPEKDGKEAKPSAIAAYRDVVPLKARKLILKPMQQALLDLSARANPLLRPQVEEYQLIVAQLIRGKAGGLDERLQKLAAQRAQALTRKSSIDDYLNWYEATQMKTASGAFDSYFRAAREIKAAQETRRPDAVSAYLDGLELEFR